MKNILLTNIKYPPTCITLNILQSLAYEICKPKMDPHSHTRVPRKKPKELDERNNCKQYCLSTWGEENRTNAEILLHTRIRYYLKIAQDINIEFISKLATSTKPPGTSVKAGNKRKAPPKTQFINFPWDCIKPDCREKVQHWLDLHAMKQSPFLDCKNAFPNWPKMQKMHNKHSTSSGRVITTNNILPTKENVRVSLPRMERETTPNFPCSM